MERLTNTGEVPTLRQLRAVYDRLAAYEDTGLTPEEIIKLNDFKHSQLAIAVAKQQEAEKKSNFWMREAINANATLGEIRIKTGAREEEVIPKWKESILDKFNKKSSY